LNSFLGRTDFGWLRLHPSPYLLVPVLIGYRYGFLAGVVSGLLSGAVIVIGQLLLGVSLATLVAEHGYLLGALAFLGGLCGEIQSAPRKRELQLTVLYENAQQRLRRLDDDLRLLRETKAELERVLASRDADLANLDSEMRRLSESEGDELYYNLLLLLSRQARVTDAALYVLEPPDVLERKAFIGDPARLPPRTKTREIEMAQLALRNRTVVTIPEFWGQAEGKDQPYLMAMPLLDPHEQPLGVLLVTGMPFVALTKRAVQLAALICRWAARVVDLRRQAGKAYRLVAGLENQRVFFEEAFRGTLELAHSACRMHNLPSYVLILAAPGRAAGAQKELEEVIMANVRGGDFATVLNLSMPNLAILLPLTGERGAGIFRDRILAYCGNDPLLGDSIATRLVAVAPARTFEDIWDELHETADFSAGGPGAAPVTARP
jgi:hypothetical protein